MRVTVVNMPTCAARFISRHVTMLPRPALMAERVSKVMVDGQCVGTLVRITPAGLCVSATHVLVDDEGRFVQQATAFGGAALHLLGSSPWHDVVFVQGRFSAMVAAEQQHLAAGGSSPI